MRRRFIYTIASFLFVAMQAVCQQPNGDWRNVLQERLAVYGHRNWIVIADSAYPAQTADGIETILTGADHFQVLETVLRALDASRHVRPKVYTDRELAAVSEEDAPGISSYREQLSAVLNTLQSGNVPVRTILHADIISKLDNVSHSFRVLILKTNLTLPYTSVFLELDCAYWSADAERRLRSVLAAQSGH